MTPESTLIRQLVLYKRRCCNLKHQTETGETETHQNYLNSMKQQWIGTILTLLVVKLRRKSKRITSMDAVSCVSKRLLWSACCPRARPT